MSGDFATYLMRSLLSEGRVRYETVESTPQGIRPRLIEREGHTGSSSPPPRSNSTPRTRPAS